MRVVDLFCGAGGFSKGFLDAGFEIKYGIEIDRFAAETYQKNIGNVIVRDIRNVHSSELERVEVVIGGPPCEPYTVTNAKRRENPLERLYDDELGRLVLHFIRIIGDLEPEAFIMENVMGILEGELKSALKYEFGRIGYTVKKNVFNAENYGVPSVRTRVFISNVRLKLKRERKKNVINALEGLPDPREKYIPNHVYRPLPSRVEKKIHRLRFGKGIVFYRGAKGVFKNYIRLHPYRPAPTVMGSSRFIHPFQDRLLTVREHARLMTYPNNFEFLGPIESQYNQVGESVPPLLAKKIAECIKKKI